MTPLIALDWGTSSLRAARFDRNGNVAEERALPRGILTVAPGGFPAVFQEAIAGWHWSPRTPFLLSGMVGSRQGWLEAPYCACPAGFADVAAALAWVEPGRIAIVPGLSCEAAGVPDVMRGEETQVFGALELLGTNDGTFVLPGTHSKWASVREGRIEGFSTYMTGEFYALLRRHSILARTLPDGDGELDEAAFERGVHHALQAGNLLHAAFSVRTLSLFDRMPAASLPSYLSGLVIGEELRSQAPFVSSTPVVVIGSAALAQRYGIALRAVGAQAHLVGEQATWRGLWAVGRALGRCP